jgi:hypothetical protein
MITQQLGEGMVSNLPKLNAAIGQLVKPIAMSLSPTLTTGLLPAGVTGIPASISQVASSQPSSSNQPIILQIDGRQFARLILPHVVSQVRNTVGAWSI